MQFHVSVRTRTSNSSLIDSKKQSNLGFLEWKLCKLKFRIVKTSEEQLNLSLYSEMVVAIHEEEFNKFSSGSNPGLISFMFRARKFFSYHNRMTHMLLSHKFHTVTY